MNQNQIFQVAKEDERFYIIKVKCWFKKESEMKKSDKAFPMIGYLEEQLLAGAYSSGQRMPSLRALMRKFKISYGTARRGMLYLHEKYAGISKETGRGTYFNPELSGNGPKEGHSVVVCGDEQYSTASCLYYSALRGIISSAEKASVRIEKVMLKSDFSDIAMLRKITSRYSGAILLGQYDAVFSRLDLSVPAVGVMMENSFDGAVSVVDLDPYLTAKLAVRYFLERKIRKVKILSSMNNAFLLRGKIFAMLAAEHGIRCSAPVTEIKSYRAGTGYFFTSDTWANIACHRYREATGRELAADHVIMGADGKQLLQPGYSRFPTVAVDWEQIGVTAFTECMERINDPLRTAKKIFLTGWFVNYPE